MTNQPENGTHRIINGRKAVFYDGYWIRHYPVPEDTLDNRKALIDHMTRRAFHHTESGINTPGERLEEARQAYEAEQDPKRKRVNAAMLAGALFNRATDIFNGIVELEHKGVMISRDNELMKQCSNSFRAALELGKEVKHYSGEEGIDELWGEPFKAFTQPIDKLFESRYRKIAQTMHAIDQIADRLITSVQYEPSFANIVNVMIEFASASKRQIETMKSDRAFFTIWPIFVTAREGLENFNPKLPESDDLHVQRHFDQGVKLIKAGTALITYLAEARVPMPKSTKEFFDQCDAFQRGAGPLTS